MYCGQAYDQSGSFGSAFKALEGFEGLLERTVIAADVRRRASALLTTLTIDLAKVNISSIAGVSGFHRVIGVGA